MEESSILPREELEKLVKQISDSIAFRDSYLELYSPDRFLHLLSFLEDHFYPDETLSKTVGIVPIEDVKDLWQYRLRHNISLSLVSHITGETIGALTMMVTSRESDTSDHIPVITSEKVNKIGKVLNYPNGGLNTFTHFCVDVAIDFLTIVVHKDHRGQGISSKLLESGLLMCKDIGLKPVCVGAAGTSNCSQYLFEKFGFDVLGSVNLKDFNVDGNVVFDNIEGSARVKFYAKRL